MIAPVRQLKTRIPAPWPGARIASRSAPWSADIAACPVGPSIEVSPAIDTKTALAWIEPGAVPASGRAGDPLKSTSATPEPSRDFMMDGER